MINNIYDNVVVDDDEYDVENPLINKCTLIENNEICDSGAISGICFNRNEDDDYECNICIFKNMCPML
jgi:hypothetical protein